MHEGNYHSCWRRSKRWTNSSRFIYNNIQVNFQNCAPFHSWISEINKTQVNNAKDLGIVIPMYNLIEYNDNYSETPDSLWQYCRDKQDNNIINSDLFKLKSRLTSNTFNTGTAN